MIVPTAPPPYPSLSFDDVLVGTIAIAAGTLLLVGLLHLLTALVHWMEKQQ